MIARILSTFVFTILIVACIVIPEGPVSSPGRQPTAINLVTTPVDSFTATVQPLQSQAATASEQAPTPATGSFELIGHSPLLQRGMNAAPAIYGNYAYIGSRTDGRHGDAGVLVVDISNPANPEVIYQIGPPEEGLVGQTSRELRVWPDQEILLVMNMDCDAVLHDCGQSDVPAQVSFYDISGTNATVPKLILAYSLGRTPH